METPAGFDLNAAIETWRQELLAQPGLAPDDRRELEAHLRDTVAELRRRGMDDEESFVLARHRVGKPPQIATEFANADPLRTWRQRMLWMAAALLVMDAWSSMYTLLFNISFVLVPRPANFMVVIWEAASLVFYLLPVVWLAVVLSEGRITRLESWIHSIFSSRRRFILIAGIAVSSSIVLRMAIESHATLLKSHSVPAVLDTFRFMVFQIFMGGQAFATVKDFALIALVAWLMPAPKRETPKLA